MALDNIGYEANRYNPDEDYPCQTFCAAVILCGCLVLAVGVIALGWWWFR
jgi:hypothetical protein